MPNFSFNILVKPIGSVCNLHCDYCYYLNKNKLYPDTIDFRMSYELLEEFTRQYIQYQPGPLVSFIWQGGEPTLLGLDFFRRVVELQEKFLPVGWQATNSLQTNGTLLTDEWCDFLHKNQFLVGLSLDGSANLHNFYRHTKSGQETFSQVMSGLHLLQTHKIEYNVLCVVSKANVQHPIELYHFFKENGIKYIQFIPLVESLEDGKVSQRSITGEEYGQFLISIFNQWVVNGLGEISVQIFDECISVWAGLGANLCISAPTCGRAMAMEHNGDVYSCDHFVFPPYKLGNIRDQKLIDLVNSEKQVNFGRQKKEALPECCQSCSVRFICNGGCPKNRILPTADGRNLNYLCAGYKRFFSYIDPYMRDIAEVLKRRQPLGLIKKRVFSVHKSIWSSVGRNDPCPCGSGKKYKKCCQPSIESLVKSG